MALFNRATYNTITNSTEFRLMQQAGGVSPLSIFSRADIKTAMLATFQNLRGKDAKGRPKYDNFLRRVETADTAALKARIRSFGP